MTTKQTDRCPNTRLTRYQAAMLAMIATGRELPSHHEWPAVVGVLRSLVTRGMITSRGNVTEAGHDALFRCVWFSPRQRRSRRL